MQDGAFAPMDLPRAKSPGQHFYARVDPRALVGEEEIVVAMREVPNESLSLPDAIR